MESKAFWARTAPTFAKYLSRIGGEQRSGRKFVVMERGDGGYHQDIAHIEVIGEGQIKCSAPHLDPTEAETTAIAVELANFNWPKSLPARDMDDLKKLVRDDSPLYVYRNSEGLIPFVQERRFRPDGRKADLPWSFWSDATWKRQEPDGPLPLYNVDRLSDALSVMIHEGAKTAHEVSALVAGQRSHPWLEELSEHIHIGWPGGALSPHRVDWEPIRRLPTGVRVIVVCDHDRPGEGAGSKISKILGRSLEVLRFDGRFPPTFDLADDFPAALWQDRRYTGPGIEDCLSPGTWATRQTPSKEKGRRQFELSEAFVGDWYHSIKPDAYVHKKHVQWVYSEDEFNQKIAPFTDVDNVARLLVKKLTSAADSLVYKPSEPSGLISAGRQRAINVHRPSEIKPREGDPGPFLDFIDRLVTDESDRGHLLKWCATLVARPDIRMQYGILLVSEIQGVGKTTIAEKILAPLVGVHNCSFPTPHEVVHSAFSSWRSYKRFVVIGEIYDGGSSKAYNRLKQFITDDMVRVEEKYQKPFDIENTIHIFASSNSLRALKLAESDRRWFVPAVAEEKSSPEYWREFNEWLAGGGLPIIAWWAAAYVEVHGPVRAGDEAPPSSTKEAMVVAAYSPGEQLVYELALRLKDLERPAVVRLDNIRQWLAGKKSGSGRFGADGSHMLESPETISRILRSVGLYIPHRQFKSGDRFRIVSTRKIGDDEQWVDLKLLEVSTCDIESL